MFAFTRSAWQDDVKWNEAPAVLGAKDGLVALECWRYGSMDCAIDGVNCRQQWFPNASSINHGNTSLVDHQLGQWLEHQIKGPSFQPSGLGEAKLRGGLRLIICEASYGYYGLSMTRFAFDLIQQHFNLHEFTLPAAFRLGGAMYCDADPGAPLERGSPIRMIIKFHQKIEIGTCLLSLSHDVTSGRTDILICGHGFITPRYADKPYGGLREQILKAILTSPELWDNPLLLPSIIHHNYISRLDKRSRLIATQLVTHENALGLHINANSALEGAYRSELGEEMDERKITVQLHVLATHLTYLGGVCNWLGDLSGFIVRQEQLLRERGDLRAHEHGFLKLRESTVFLSTVVDGLAHRFQIYQQRANLHITILFSITNQQNSALALLDSRLNILIASSAKQDSISMTTFTFITALFLPGTFVATVFSMSMFNWQNENSASSSPSSSSSSGSLVATTFWIFWATAAPLTLVTLAGWYVWSKYARWRWVEKLKEATDDDRSPLRLSSASFGPTFLAGFSRKGR